MFGGAHAGAHTSGNYANNLYTYIYENLPEKNSKLQQWRGYARIVRAPGLRRIQNNSLTVEA